MPFNRNSSSSSILTSAACFFLASVCLSLPSFFEKNFFFEGKNFFQEKNFKQKKFNICLSTAIQWIYVYFFFFFCFSCSSSTFSFFEDFLFINEAADAAASNKWDRKREMCLAGASSGEFLKQTLLLPFENIFYFVCSILFSFEKRSNVIRCLKIKKRYFTAEERDIFRIWFLSFISIVSISFQFTSLLACFRLILRCLKDIFCFTHALLIVVWSNCSKSIVIFSLFFLWIINLITHNV